MTDDKLREALQGMRQPQPGIVYIADVLAYVEPELERLDKVVKLLGAHLQGGAQDVKGVLTAMVDLEADRDRARDAAVALEQENARLERVLDADRRIEEGVRDDVRDALAALHKYDGAEAAKVLSDLLESLGGGS